MKPIIGIAGGIGSGKSTVARLFGELGCVVISSDDQVRQAYKDPAVLEEIRDWWGAAAFHPDGTLNRRAVADRVFASPEERRRLEGLIHPRVQWMRDAVMADRSHDPEVPAFIWDTPLLFETGLNEQCDAVVFVDTPDAARQQRLTATRGWQAGEFRRREKSQLPLDRKRQMSDYVISNAADAGGTSSPRHDQPGLEQLRGQVRDVLSRILEPTR
jgi:dephospho-CoA kinase